METEVAPDRSCSTRDPVRVANALGAVVRTVVVPPTVRSSPGPDAVHDAAVGVGVAARGWCRGGTDGAEVVAWAGSDAARACYDPEVNAGRESAPGSVFGSSMHSCGCTSSAD